LIRVPTSICGRFEDVIKQYEPGSPVKPKQFFVAWRSPLRGPAADARADGTTMTAVNSAAKTRALILILLRCRGIDPLTDSGLVPRAVRALQPGAPRSIRYSAILS
jgi:hypothetical protein